ncbi:uncharacterized protein ATC70_012272 [Mucor velutinosus]|uniref:BAR-domain-containing protein n=1 Tax=Mucor velutinosus TaxID=708070 RepID=A0AAN7D5V9_9FUNG|nr:hypothetical protein ATC70_012272 [Mucor velutinosus]
MIKNLGKFKQWTGEKFGGAKVTLQTDDFQRLEQETEHRREGYDKVLEAVDGIASYLLKRKTSPEDGKTKQMPFETLGSCLYHYGTVFPEDSALGIALINLGQTETRLAALQEALANEIRMGYMTTLENGQQEYKEYDSLRKKLASRRLDYDSKLNRLNKAKKEKPELEQEMQASRIKYEDTEHDLIQKMAYIQEFENEHRDALLDMVEAQAAYHTQAKELLESLKKNWGEGSNSDPSDILGRVMVRKSSQDSYHSVSTDNISAHHRNQPPSLKMSRDSSVDTFASSGMSYHNNSSDTVDRPLPNNQVLPPLSASDPVHKELNHIDHTKYRRALFDFTGQNQDEISFKTGDIIAVIDEIDVGWWLGECHQKKGIFPVNYTEEYDPQTQPLPPLPKKHEMPPAVLENERSPLEQLQQPQEQQKSLPELNAPTHPLTNPRVVDVTYNPPVLDHSDAIATTPTHASVVSSTSIRRPPPPPVTTSSPAVTTLRSGSLSRKRSTAIRAPPPPPPSVRTANHTIESSTSSTTASPVIIDSPHRLVEEPPTIGSTTSLPAAAVALTPSPSQSLHEIQHDATPVALDEPCNECECHEFIENVFKKGYCNNCFHKHHD